MMLLVSTLLPILSALVGGELTSPTQPSSDVPHRTLISDLRYGSMPDDATSGTVVVLFFHDDGSPEATDGYMLLNQLDDYFRSHPNVDIRLCKVACTDHKEQFCRKNLVNKAVHALRHGHPRVTLSLTGASPLDAVIATSLHLWLADRVSVLNTARELDNLQRRCRGHCNVLVAYFPSLAAAEHRLLLEAALEQETDDDTNDVSGRLQFAMTSAEEAVVGLPPPLYQSLEDQMELQNPRLWILLCIGEEPAPLAQQQCTASGFQAELTADELRQFLLASSRPGWAVAPPLGDVLGTPFDPREVHVLLLLADAASLRRVTAIAPTLGQMFRGSVGFVVVDMDTLPTGSLTRLGLDRQRLYLPSLAFIVKGTTTVSAVINEYDDAVGFIETQLIKYLKMLERKQREEADLEDHEFELESVPDVLKQDDELELSLPEEDDFGAIRDISADEFKSMSRSDDFAVVVAYLPWDPVSRSLLWELVTLPKALQRHLSRLNCLDWSDLCDQMGVRSHPYVAVISGGQQRQHNGSLSGADVRELINNGAAPLPLPTDDAQLARWTARKLTGSPLDGTDRLLLLPASRRPDPGLRGRLRGMILVAQMDGGQMMSMFGKTSSLCVKRSDPFQSTQEVDEAKLEESINHCVPVLPELNEESYHGLVASQWTFLLFCPPQLCPSSAPVTDELTQAVGGMAMTVPNCYWINSSSAVGREVQQQYQLTSPSGVVAVNLTSGHVVPYGAAAGVQPLRAWALDVLAGLLPGQVLLKSEPWLPVLPPIDFSSAPGQTQSESKVGLDSPEVLHTFQGAADGPQSQRDEL